MTCGYSHPSPAQGTGTSRVASFSAHFQANVSIWVTACLEIAHKKNIFIVFTVKDCTGIVGHFFIYMYGILALVI